MSTSELPSGYGALERRMGRDALSSRLNKQASHWADLNHQGEGIFRLEKFLPVDRILGMAFAITGIGWIGRRNVLNIRTVEQTWWLPRLPKAFDGFRLLQISDLHIDLLPELAGAVAAKIAETPHDATVFTGDYRNTTRDDHEPALQLLRGILAKAGFPRFGILGNHDYIEMVWGLENLGLPMLVNEASSIERDGGRIWIAGVDDPHFYRTHNPAQARANIPDEAFRILLSHSPECHAEAAALGYDLMLCGHTHGGQICLPGGRHLYCPVRNLPSRFIRGRWKSDRMQGYTSPGTGACGVPVRLFCPPEITVHILKEGVSPIS